MKRTTNRRPTRRLLTNADLAATTGGYDLSGYETLMNAIKPRHELEMSSVTNFK